MSETQSYKRVTVPFDPAEADFVADLLRDAIYVYERAQQTPRLSDVELEEFKKKVALAKSALARVAAA